jgi:hypothetical protein
MSKFQIRGSVVLARVLASLRYPHKGWTVGVTFQSQVQFHLIATTIWKVSGEQCRICFPDLAVSKVLVQLPECVHSQGKDKNTTRVLVDSVDLQIEREREMGE